MPSTLRLRLGQGAAALLALGILCHGLGTYVTFNISSGSADFQTRASTSATFIVVLTTIGTFCIAVAVAVATGIVASLVVEEGLERRLWMDAGLADDDDAGTPDTDAD